MKFYDLHPLSLITYFTSVILFTMITMNPILLLLSLFGSLFSNYIITKKISFWMYIIIFLSISLTNPIFSHNGETVLFYFFKLRITFEAVVYGVFAGVLITSVIIWFNNFSRLFTQDKISWVAGKISPKLCTVLSMSLRFIPLFKENAKAIYTSQIAMGIFDTSHFKGKMQLLVNVFSALVSMSAENAIETADVMHSKGFGTGKRSIYSLFIFSKRDIIIIILTFITDILIFYMLYAKQGEFYYYPVLQFGKNSEPHLYLVFAILCFIPIINDIWEDIKWKYLISKI